MMTAGVRLAGQTKVYGRYHGRLFESIVANPVYERFLEL